MEEQDGNFRAWEFKWNPGSKVRLSKTFANAYQNTEFSVVTPDNAEDFLI